MARGGYRPGSGPAKGTKYRPRASKGKPILKLKAPKKPEIPQDIKDEAKAANLTPLEYMLKVMNDPMEKDNARKDRMAIAAAPFVHPRIAEGAGKKKEKDDKAKQAGGGKFAAGRVPLSLVK